MPGRDSRGNRSTYSRGDYRNDAHDCRVIVNKGWASSRTEHTCSYHRASPSFPAAVYAASPSIGRGGPVCVLQHGGSASSRTGRGRPCAVRDDPPLRGRQRSHGPCDHSPRPTSQRARSTRAPAGVARPCNPRTRLRRRAYSVPVRRLTKLNGRDRWYECLAARSSRPTTRSSVSSRRESCTRSRSAAATVPTRHPRSLTRSTDLERSLMSW